MTGDQIPESDGDRRRLPREALSPLDALAQMPSLVLLERLPTPALAVAADGVIVFVNSAFANLVGRTAVELGAMRLSELMFDEEPDGPVRLMLDRHADRIVALRHDDGSEVRAKMSRSAFIRSDDTVALVIFDDLTEQIWNTGRMPSRRS